MIRGEESQRTKRDHSIIRSAMRSGPAINSYHIQLFIHFPFKQERRGERKKAASQMKMIHSEKICRLKMILGEVNHTGEKLWNTLRIAHPRIGYLVGNPAFAEIRF